MKSTYELSDEEHSPLLALAEQDLQTSDTRPGKRTGSVSTGLQNVQCMNLVSVCVNVSTNREERKDGSSDNRPHAKNKDPQLSNTSNVRGISSIGGLFPKFFSTLLRNFQIFNLVSVMVNVSTNHEDEPLPKPSRKSEKKRCPDYYQDIFGEGGDKEGQDSSEKKSDMQSRKPTYRYPSKIPILFRLHDSEYMETFTVTTSTTYADITSQILDLAKTSPNCIPSSTKCSPTTDPAIQALLETTSHVLEINVDWDIGEGRDWPRRSRLTERNCEAVLLLMERGMMGVLDVRMDGGMELKMDGDRELRMDGGKEVKKEKVVHFKGIEQQD
ncbi:hypothetical protein FKW77_005681 [Venturia effusa]|uniref:Uncharacterized protein n=1 Tax=Venturia effusa TaxID=50376 RepID=A0A517LMV8_9PEZI|nr:hypothetical protein FKW77_005681 [Venturia effusa]